MTKILVIEDEANTRNMFQQCLEFEGYQTIGAKDGLTGIEQVQKYLPDLVICDILVPKLDGYKVLARLRQEASTATIPFIFLSAMTSKADLRKGMEMGADDYLTKPSTVEELIGAVTAQLKKQALLQRCYAAESHPGSESSPVQAAQSNSEDIFPGTAEFKAVFQFIEDNFQQGITLSDVAQAVGYSPAYLTNKVKCQTGHTVNRWIIERRMAAARSLLKNTDQSIEKIATVVGYANVCHFFRQFRQYNQASPQIWRKKNLG